MLRGVEWDQAPVGSRATETKTESNKDDTSHQVKFMLLSPLPGLVYCRTDSEAMDRYLPAAEWGPVCDAIDFVTHEVYMLLHVQRLQEVIRSVFLHSGAPV